MKLFWKTHRQDVYSVLVILSACFVFAFLLLHLYEGDLAVPFTYAGDDGLPMYAKAKLLQQQFWDLENPWLGAPFTAEHYDFMANAMTYTENLALKLLGLIFTNPIVALNVQYLLLFPTIALISYFVMRSLKLRCLVSVPCSVAFAFLPAIFFRGIGHFSLTAYQFVPLSILLCIWLYTDDQFLRCKGFWHYRRNIYAIVFALLIANNGIAYYAFFTCFFLAVTGVMKALRDRKWKPLLRSAANIGFVCFFLVLSLTPVILYQLQNGTNPIVAARNPMEAELYSTRLSLLLLPTSGHGVPLLRSWVADYKNAPLLNENTFSHIGLVGVAGFVFLFFYFFVKKKDTLRYRQMSLLAGLNLFGFLLGTMGGLGSLFAVIVTPALRAYNRVSVFLAFICILAVALLLDRYTRKLKTWLVAVLMGLMCVVTVLEQYPPYWYPNYNVLRTAYQSDASFVQQIESEVPDGAMIYQMPYVFYPEAGTVNEMGAYSHFTGFLHSKNLRWSYGGMHGRKSDLWNSAVDQLPLSDKLKVLSITGFEGIYIDTRAYDEAELKELTDNLQRELNIEPLVSSDGRLLFFNMDSYNQAYRAKYTEEERQAKKEELLKLTQPVYGEGISSLEKDSLGDYHWSSKAGLLTINNNQSEPLDASLHLMVMAGDGKTSRFTVTINGIATEFQITPEGTEIDLTFSAKAGTNTIRLETDGNQVAAPGDPRSLYFQIRDLSCSLTDADLGLK